MTECVISSLAVTSSSRNRFCDGVDRSLQKGTAFAGLTSGCIIGVPKGLGFGDMNDYLYSDRLFLNSNRI